MGAGRAEGADVGGGADAALRRRGPPPRPAPWGATARGQRPCRSLNVAQIAVVDAEERALRAASATLGLGDGRGPRRRRVEAVWRAAADSSSRELRAARRGDDREDRHRRRRREASATWYGVDRGSPCAGAAARRPRGSRPRNDEVAVEVVAIGEHAEIAAAPPAAYSRGDLAPDRRPRRIGPADGDARLISASTRTGAPGGRRERRGGPAHRRPRRPRSPPRRRAARAAAPPRPPRAWSPRIVVEDAARPRRSSRGLLPPTRPRRRTRSSPRATPGRRRRRRGSPRASDRARQRRPAARRRSPRAGLRRQPLEPPAARLEAARAPARPSSHAACEHGASWRSPGRARAPRARRGSRPRCDRRHRRRRAAGSTSSSAEARRA